MSDLDIGLRVAGSQLESFGVALTHKLGALNVWTAALLGSALVLDRALSRRVRASFRVALYAPVALRVLLPLDWHVPIVSAPPVTSFLAPLQRLGAPPADELPTWHTPSWHALAAVVYAVVVLLLAARAIALRVRLRRALAAAEPAKGPYPGVPCPVLLHEELGPMAVGVLAPRIVLPRRLLAEGEEHALACVLRHELAHLRRRDAWLALGMQLLSIAAWPVVPLWIAALRVRQLVELACDEAALAGADATERRRYGHALLDMAEWRSFGVAPLGAGELHFGSTLRARIEALAAQRHWPLAAQAIALVFAPIALLVACTGSAPTSAATAATASGEEAAGYGYEFETDSQKAAAARAPAAKAAGPDGRVPPEVIQSAVRARFDAFRTCYEAGLTKDPKLAGTVTVKYEIAKDGTTVGAADEKSTLPDKDVVACIVGEFGRVTYPSGGESATVVYPIMFSP